MKKTANFEDLLQEAFGDLYDAEKQIAAALPRMMAASSSEELSGALASDLEDTKGQLARLETLFERFAAEPGGRECRPVLAVFGEGERLIGEVEKSPVLDAALIDVFRKVKHYEIAAYRTACGLAEMLGQQEAFNLLNDTLVEETEADADLEELLEALLSGDTGTAEDEEEEVEEEEQ